MLFFHTFIDQKEVEVLKYQFVISGQKVLQLNIIDGCFEHAPIIIRDPHGQIRGLYSLKTRIKSHFIGPTWKETTNGGLPGPFPKGIWSLEILKPSLRVTGKIQLEIRFDRQINDQEETFAVLSQNFTQETPGKTGWLTAELHCHSYYSDGRVNLADISNWATQRQLDLVALTDHSVVTTKFPKINQLFLPGTELTLDNEVHYNVYGLNKFIDYPKYFDNHQTKNENINAMFADLKKAKYLLSINHPFADGMTLQHDFDIRNFNLLEVINSAPYATEDIIDNKKAIRFFDFLWQEGHYLFGIGGSDAHKNSYQQEYPMAIPQNKIYVEQRSIAAVLESMRHGHVIVASNYQAKISLMDERGQTVLPGSEYNGLVHFQALGERPVTWHVIKNGQCIYETLADKCEYTAKVAAGDYIRFDAFAGQIPVVFVNPLYSQLKVNPQLNFFQELLAQFARIC
ncbi:CehA/McbA family metallohydrolase [Lactobacillus sp. ESL0791]|uniref:CehA/McbA family metallohydrolase n=1 Tax=Lactobacillus sp. ESL0791 TaxID=2983234 RepID=UPI0023F8096D|nr:CehA/McbA family metallohydrolase [Lactobacillus sp. ESL0791]MDF7637999.1 CehA/McbA family metallohydrolase [Lactobacillus sp. ESL0791]